MDNLLKSNFLCNALRNDLLVTLIRLRPGKSLIKFKISINKRLDPQECLYYESYRTLSKCDLLSSAFEWSELVIPTLKALRKAPLP